MSFEKRVRLRLALSLLILIAGLSLIVLAVIGSARFSSFSDGYFSGLGFGLAAGGMVVAIKNNAVLRNKEKLRAKRIEEEDERNNLINLTSSHIAFSAVLLLLFAGSIYFAFMDSHMENIFAAAVLLSIAVKFISYYIIRHRM